MAIATLTPTTPSPSLGTNGGSSVLVIPPVDRVPVLGDDGLLGLMSQLDAAARCVAAAKARVAGEIARRSTFAAGHTGLAARLGERTPEKLIQRLTGVSAGEARELTVAGAVLRDAEEGAAYWLQVVATAVEDGRLSVAGAAAVAKGLGEPTESVSEAALIEATQQVVDFATTATPEETVARARAVRDEIDTAGVAGRERMLRAQRSFTTRVLPSGITRAIVDLDPESAAIVLSAVNARVRVAKTKTEIRFMTAAERDAQIARAAAAADGAGNGALGADGVSVRTTEQAALDAVVDIVQLATRAAGSTLDPTRIFGDSSPAVRVHVQAADLAAGVGTGHLEGQATAVSIDTVTRLICTSGILPVLFEGNTPIDAGCTKRLHSTRQRIALAAAWGGCAWPGCEQPEHACEVHHIERWNGKNTTLCNGIPLCRFHHVELHTNGWILTRGPNPNRGPGPRPGPDTDSGRRSSPGSDPRRDHDRDHSPDSGETIWLEPPSGHPTITRRPLRSKSPLHRVA
jgi:hypothetical protein